MLAAGICLGVWDMGLKSYIEVGERGNSRITIVLRYRKDTWISGNDLSKFELTNILILKIFIYEYRCDFGKLPLKFKLTSLLIYTHRMKSLQIYFLKLGNRETIYRSIQV